MAKVRVGKTGSFENVEGEVNARYTTWEQILFDLDIKTNKAILFSEYTVYIDLVNHLEDHLITYIDIEEYEKIKKQETARVIGEFLIRFRGVFSNIEEINEESPQEYQFLIARGKFRALRILMAKRSINMPSRTFDDEV